MAFKIDVKVDDREVKDLFRQLLARCKDLTPVMKIIGETVVSSVKRNFELGGRPTKWKPLKPATIKRKGHADPLVDKGHLRDSVHAQAHADRVVIGTNLKYAAIHQFGGEIDHPAGERVLHFKTFGRGKYKGRTLFSKASRATHGRKLSVAGYKIAIPARPYLVVQEEDWAEIKQVLTDHLMKAQ